MRNPTPRAFTRAALAALVLCHPLTSLAQQAPKPPADLVPVTPPGVTAPPAAPSAQPAPTNTPPSGTAAPAPSAPPAPAPQVPPAPAPSLPPGAAPQMPPGAAPQMPPGLVPSVPPGAVPSVPPAAAPFPGTGAALDQRWIDRFLAARRRLGEGRFGDAAIQLDALARTAPDAIWMARAAELAGLARQWSAQGLVLRAPNEPAPEKAEDREDKRTIDELAFLYTDAAVWGGGLGVTLGFSVKNSTPAWFFVPAIAGSLVGAGAIAALDLSGDRRLRYGVPHSITAGLYTGLEAGFFAAMIGSTTTSSDISAGAFAAMIWGGATAGAIAGGVIANNVGTTPGRASLVQSGAMWGGLVSTFVGVGACNCGDRGPWIAGLTGGTAAAIGAGFLGSAISPSIARVRFIDLGGVGGGLILGGIYASIASSTGWNARAFSFLTAAGVAGGVIGVGFATNKMDRDLPRRQPEKPPLAGLRPTLAAVPQGMAVGVGGDW